MPKVNENNSRYLDNFIASRERMAKDSAQKKKLIREKKNQFRVMSNGRLEPSNQNAALLLSLNYQGKKH